MNNTKMSRHHQQSQPKQSPTSSEGRTDGRVPVVWVTNWGGHPYSKAERFGRLLALTKGTVNPFKLDRIAYTVGLMLKQADEEDYLLISGLPVVVGVIMAMWLTKFKKVKILQWSIRAQDYEAVTLYAETVYDNALQLRGTGE